MKSPRNKTIVLSEEDVWAYFQNPNPHIICGNLLEKIDLVENESVDLLLTDPPYNLSKDFGKAKFNRVSNESYREYTREWLSVVLPKLKKNASVYICCDWKCSNIIQEVMEELGIFILNRITWKRDKGRGALKNWKNNSEDIWYGVLDKNDYYFDLESVKVKKEVICPYKNEDGTNRDWEESSEGRFRMTCPPNIWTDIVIPFWSMPENTSHPTQKPEMAMERIINASCPKDGMVLDCFCGSGSTLVSAKKLGRRYRGLEVDPYWCAVSDFRLKNDL